MREILFRGKTERGEWVKGVPFFGEYRCYIIEDLFICDEYECVGADNDLVIPETVGQYTGLTDKNGKKIFEGDIIKADNWLHQNMKIYTIVFENSGFYAKHKDEDCWNFDHLENIEIIGNIHDNPELLKDGAE